MQLLLETGTENGKNQGLGLIKGNVDILSETSETRLPNVGWYDTEIYKKGKFEFLSKFNKNKFYYIHAYKANPQNNENIIGSSFFNNKKFCSIISNNLNVIGTQFHPEKSSQIGLEFLEILIKNFEN